MPYHFWQDLQGFCYPHSLFVCSSQNHRGVLVWVTQPLPSGSIPAHWSTSACRLRRVPLPALHILDSSRNPAPSQFHTMMWIWDTQQHVLQCNWDTGKPSLRVWLEAEQSMQRATHTCNMWPWSHVFCISVVTEKWSDPWKNCRIMTVSCVWANTDATRRVLHALVLHLPAYQKQPTKAR